MHRSGRGMLAATIFFAISTTALLIFALHQALEHYLIHLDGALY